MIRARNRISLTVYVFSSLGDRVFNKGVSMIVHSKSALVAPVLAVLVLGSLTACSPSAPSSGGTSAGGGGSSGSTNVCSLVSASAASSAMGVTFTGSKSASLGAGMDNCTYATSASSFALIVEVYQGSSTSWTTLEGVLSSLGSVKSVSGVGDKAALGSSQLDVQAGSRFIAISGDSVGTNPSGAEALAKKFVSALG
jgi:hypothetical protein